MSEQQPGLRFDIYERVHLPEEVSAIQELDEVELTPHIRVAVEGEQAIVRGYLLLTGSYTGQADRTNGGAQTLEHTIPVEITLPINRVRSVDDISVEIENFDIDLLSARSLNVTGVLSLNGIEMEPGIAELWQEEEEILFVHESPKRDESPAIEGAGQAEDDKEEDQDQTFQQPAIEHPAFEQPVFQQPTFTAPSFFRPETGQAAPDVSEIEAAERERVKLPDNNYEDLEALAEYDNEPEAKPASALPAEEPVQADEAEKGEMKIAFGSKKPEHPETFDLKSYVGKSDEYRPGPKSTPAAVGQPAPQAGQRFGKPFRQEPVTVPEAAAESDVLEWKNLFISASEEQQFRKVRLCIVHKEDTLESIAKKYDRKPQELRLYNGMSDQEVTEGQVIYIP
ncbi:LysM peptidoglycan-binding domain-containing protein [Paenibacillus ginsengarvi]|uniref:LysM peptidoglycan-binding domain-containing protein n=1 Tax=Paenibacillus ginsengarvi TaxID=400777 RepID=A0A3B0CE92_9BACL|nr:LysM peptidoglycan-binding domain-containing protein [Paenibacillus ginsengarvi]RKN83862.1 LysM peptidoglycan-binding domain-containing protein [Paenibacillus ginsengarvi]